MSVTNPKTLPQANGDFYALYSTLSEEDQSLLQRVRAFLEAEVAPVITEYWILEEFPFQILPKLAELHIMGLPYQGYGCPGKSMVLDGILMMELARVDSSFATFRGVHSGLAMGSLYTCAARKSRNSAGCRPWRAWKRSVRSG
jgi:glutaryl-CoA dehydrogenase